MNKINKKISKNKIFMTIFNYILIKLHLDKNKAKKVWENQANRDDFTEIQVDGYVHGYEELNDIIKESMDDVKNKFKVLNKNEKRIKILDYGCGTGRYIELFYRKKNIEVIGIDATKKILDKYTKKKYPDLEFYCIDFAVNENIDFIENNKESFNAIYSISVIEYIRVSKLKYVLKNLCKLLKNGGILYITFPHPNSIWDSISKLWYIRYFPITIEKYLKRFNMMILESYAAHHKHRVKRIDRKKLKNYQYVIFAKKCNSK